MSEHLAVSSWNAAGHAGGISNEFLLSVVGLHHVRVCKDSPKEESNFIHRILKSLQPEVKYVGSKGNGELPAADLGAHALCLLSVHFSSFVSASEHFMKSHYAMKWTIFCTSKNKVCMKYFIMRVTNPLVFKHVV